MKKITLLFSFLLATVSWQLTAQAVSDDANWPNSNWTLNIIEPGNGAQNIEADPTVDSNFAYDDDDTGDNSHDVLAAESPVINLTPAQTAGEPFVQISGEYVYNNLNPDEYLAIEYWDADNNSWTLFYQFPNSDTSGAPYDNYCSVASVPYEVALNISGFTATQLSGFKYRFIYNDNINGATAWNWGFCFSSPSLRTVEYFPPQFTLTTVPDCANNQFSVDVEVTDLGGATSVTVADDQGSASQQLSAAGTVTFGPYSSGTNVTFTVTNDQNTTISNSDTALYVCPPSNDECADALSLNVYSQGGGAGNETISTTTGITDSGMHPSCDDLGTNLDVWFTFDAPTSGNVKVITGGPQGSQIEVALFDACGGNELFCFNQTQEQLFTGLTAGNTYTLQVWHDEFNAGDFSIVLEEVSYTNPVFTTTVTPDCTNSQFSVDVEVTDLGGSSSVTVSDDQGSATQQLTAPGTVTFGPYTEGTNVTFTVTNDQDTSISASDQIEYYCPPANDDCDNATALTVNTDGQCTNVTSGTNLYATPSSQPDDVTGTPDDDVWFSFVATEATHKIELSNVTAVSGTSIDMGMGLYDGSNGCANLTLVDDSDPNSFIANGLTVGTTYYLRVYGWYSGSLSAQTTFDVCVTTLPQALSNQDCASAVAFTLDSGSCSNYINAHNFGSTDSGVPAPSCGYYQPGTAGNGDLWYTISIPTGVTEITLNVDNIDGLTSVAGALYSGDCSNLTEVSCTQFSSGWPWTISGLTSGDTYYLRVWDYNNNENGTFDLCGYYTPVSISENQIAGFKFYPNPVNHTLNLSAKDNIEEVSISNVMGQEVMHLTPNATETKVDMSQLQNGIYFVKAQVNGELTAFKVIKK